MSSSGRDRTGPRTVHTDADRFTRWVAGFEQRHGPCQITAAQDGGLLLVGADGEQAQVTSLVPLDLRGPAHDVEELVAAVRTAAPCAVVLVRRGGYAVAVVQLGPRPQVLASKVGTRYVQGRTAAGGWSQQRFARRRANQAGELVGAVTEHAARLLVRDDVCWLATGGDRALVEAVLADPRLRRLSALPRGPHLEVGDPRSDVVAGLATRLMQLRIRLTPAPPA